MPHVICKVDHENISAKGNALSKMWDIWCHGQER